MTDTTPRRAIILGAFRGISHLDITKSHPLSLQKLGDQTRALDWILKDLEDVGIREICYVGGYHIEKVVQNYPRLKFYYDPLWEKGDVVTTLSSASDFLDGICLLCSSDLVFRAEAVRSLLECPEEVVIGTDGRNSESVDLLKTSATGTQRLRWLLEDLRQKGLERKRLSHLAAELAKREVPVTTADLSGLWAPLSDSSALARFIFGTKAETLSRLKGRVQNACIPDQVSFTVSEWSQRPDAILTQIQKEFGDKKLVVRSSALHEDGWTSSNAGRFKSILDVDGKNAQAIAKAVRQVVESYGPAGSENGKNHVLVQPQVQDVVFSGVLLTRDLESGAPYYVVNGERSSRSNGVTSGVKSQLETVFVHKRANKEHPDPWIAGLVTSAKEIEDRLGHDSIDLEFCLNEKQERFLLQARPLVLQNNFRIADSDFEEELAQVRTFLEGHLEQPSPNLFGRRTLLGVMPDWNPAEMIGTCPQPLALSLYQRLITDRAWSLARVASGYRDVWPEPLVVSLAGRPYVDIRVSLNSFLPADLPSSIASKLIDAQLDFLQENPDRHDKIEFEIALTCLDFDFDRYQPILSRAGLDSQEREALRHSLLHLTDRILSNQIATIDDQLRQLELLEHQRISALKQAEGQPALLPRTIWRLAESCLHHGIVPFSILARYCFMSMALLRSLKKKGVFGDQELETLLIGIPTIATEITEAVHRRAEGTLSNEKFIEKYGHLRPGSYNITSPNITQALEQYFPPNALPRRSLSAKTATDRLGSAEQILDSKRREIEDLLRESGFQTTFSQLKQFIFRSIPARELSKFEFMKNVDAILESVAQWGGSMGFGREEMSFISIEQILRLATDSPSCAVQMEIGRSSGFGKKRSKLTRAIRLPYLIDSIDCLDYFKMPSCRPNFITTKTVTAEIVCLDGEGPQRSLEEKIVLIEGADPGYDWLFSHRIAGLITVYGGVASHMAIRAAEFGLPSAIGCGELIYEEIRHAKVVELDCAGQVIRRVS